MQKEGDFEVLYILLCEPYYSVSFAAAAQLPSLAPEVALPSTSANLGAGCLRCRRAPRVCGEEGALGASAS